MIRNLTLSIAFLSTIITATSAQDIHFTLYNMMPLVFNPAESGGFMGTYRLSGIYRDQWLSVTGVPHEYKTPSLSLDVPVVKGFRDNDWVGIGVLLYSDKSGSLNLQQTAFKLSGAYHFALDKKGNSIISLGYQTGSIQRRIKDLQKVDLIDDDPNLIAQGDIKSNYTDHVVGLHFRTKMSSGDELNLGAAIGHLKKGDISLSKPDTTGGSNGGSAYYVPKWFTGQGSYRAVINDRIAIVPGAFIQVLGKNQEIMGQAIAEYLFNAEKDIVLKGGLGYRVGDALQVMLGTRIRELSVMASYDINVSELSPASNAFGGFELSATVIGIIYKKPNPDPVLFCPRF